MIEIGIIGAGPGGAAAALTLEKHGVPCTLIDKATFPRDKVCGDALSGKVVSVLKRIAPNILDDFDGLQELQVDSWGIRFVAPNGRPLDVPFKNNFDKSKDTAPGYIAKRVDFDNYLAEKLRVCKHIDFREGVDAHSYEKTDKGWKITDRKGNTVLECKVLLVANGAHSSFTRKVAGIVKENDHYCAGIRAYYKDVKDLDENGFIELHFRKEFLPGYLWIFPLPGGQANVGAGMLSSTISKKKINLEQLMFDMIENSPELKRRFEGASITEKVKGYGLPLGSKKRVISGDNYMLIGDAAYLIDPFSGEGIGNAMYSGQYAAEHAMECLKAEQFDAAFMTTYDKRVYKSLGQELQLSRKMQKMLQYPWLFNLVTNAATKNQKLGETISAMFLDMDLREELAKPSFYFKLLFSRN